MDGISVPDPELISIKWSPKKSRPVMQKRKHASVAGRIPANKMF